MVHEAVRHNDRVHELVSMINQLIPNRFSSIALPVWYRVGRFVWEGATHESDERE